MFFLIFKILIQYNIIIFFLHIIKVLYLKGFFVVVVVFFVCFAGKLKLGPSLWQKWHNIRLATEVLRGTKNKLQWAL